MVPEFVNLDMPSLYALIFIVLVGLPHGAFDGAIAAHLAAKQSALNLFKFIGYYLITAALVIAAWVNWPKQMLALFLIISVLHFGWGDATKKSGLPLFTQIVVHGGIPVFGIAYFHPADVKALFDVMTFGASGLAMQLSQVAIPIIICLGVVYAGLALKEKSLRVRFMEFLIVTALVAFLPPLVGFAIYFCLIHTCRHILRIWAMLAKVNSPKVLITQALGYTISSWFLGGLAFLFLNTGSIHSQLVQVIFIGLAALTVPHMILVDGFFRAEKRIH